MPGALRDCHSSRSVVTDTLVRPTPKLIGSMSSLPLPIGKWLPTLCYLVLLQMGFTKPTCHQVAGELLPHRFTLTSSQKSMLCALGGLISVALSVGLPRLVVNQHPYPVKSRLSSPTSVTRWQRQSAPLFDAYRRQSKPHEVRCQSPSDFID